MFLATILGTITATRKHKSLEGTRLLIARRLEADGTPSGEPLIVVDPLGVHHGDTALITTDGTAIRARCGNNVPVRLSVMGIVPVMEKMTL